MEKNRKYTELQERFLEALAGEARGNVREAMNIAGYNRTSPIKDIYASLSQEIADIAQQLLATESIKAVHNLINVMEDPEQLGAKNRLSAIREVLDRAGVVKKEKIEVTASDAIFILPAKKAVTEDEQ